MGKTAEGKTVSGRPGRPRVVVPTYLRSEQAEELRRLSEERDLPQSVLIRQAIDRFIREQNP